MTDHTPPWGAVPQDDPLITFKTVQAQVSTLLASTSNQDKELGEIKQSVKDVPMMIGEMRASMNYTTGEIKELKARVETIDENKAEIKEVKIDLANVKTTIIPDGKVLFGKLTEDFEDLSDAFETYKGRYAKMFWTAILSAGGFIGFIVKDYLVPLLWAHIH